jgi:predicted nucleic acid-binding protein
LIVIDSSALLEVLLRTSKGTNILDRCLAEGETLHAPHLLDLEVAQVLRRFTLSGHLTNERAGQAFDDLLDLRLLRYPHEPFLTRIWELRANLTAYDAAYIALAEVLPAPIVTCDRRLATAGGHSARVEIF